MTHALHHATALLCAAALSIGVSSAQPYPAKPVRFVVGFPAGGTVDLVARGLGQHLAPLWGQPVVVDNRVGANGTIATEYVAKSPADGHTVLIAFSSHTINAVLYAKLPYDAQRDFVPITLIASVPNLLVVHPSLPARSVRDLIRLARARPNEITYASSGSGSPAHLSAELFKSMARIELLHVAYKGGPPTIVSVVSGETGLVFTTVMLALPHVKTGRMRALAVTTPTPARVLPEVPPIAATLPGYESASWYGMFVPRATPARITEKLHVDVTQILRTQDFRASLLSQGSEPVGNSPAEFADVIAREIAEWGKIVKALGAKVE